MTDSSLKRIVMYLTTKKKLRYIGNYDTQNQMNICCFSRASLFIFRKKKKWPPAKCLIVFFTIKRKKNYRKKKNGKNVLKTKWTYLLHIGDSCNSTAPYSLLRRSLSHIVFFAAGHTTHKYTVSFPQQNSHKQQHFVIYTMQFYRTNLIPQPVSLTKWTFSKSKE